LVEWDGSHIFDELSLFDECFLLFFLLLLLLISITLDSLIFFLILGVLSGISLSLEFGFAPLATFVSDPSWVGVLDVF